jgi:hypothetical protein
VLLTKRRLRENPRFLLIWQQAAGLLTVCACIIAASQIRVSSAVGTRREIKEQGTACASVCASMSFLIEGACAADSRAECCFEVQGQRCQQGSFAESVACATLITLLLSAYHGSL